MMLPDCFSAWSSSAHGNPISIGNQISEGLIALFRSNAAQALRRQIEEMLRYVEREVH